MPVDFTKFPYATIARPDAATLTEAITHDPVGSGFAIVTLKANDAAAIEGAVRTFAAQMRDQADSGLTAIRAYRQLRRDELGGDMPFDQPICEAILEAAAQNQGDDQIGARAAGTVLANPHLDLLVLLEYVAPDQASRAVQAFTAGQDVRFNALREAAQGAAAGAFKNMARYSSVSEDPNAVHFFNLFPAPGNPNVLWSAWQDALPWFFDIGEFRSSFPLLALDPKQPILLVNWAHLDSTKHFLNGALHDPTFAQLMASAYVQRGVTLPAPFFCKMVPV